MMVSSEIRYIGNKVFVKLFFEKTYLVPDGNWLQRLFGKKREAIEKWDKEYVKEGTTWYSFPEMRSVEWCGHLHGILDNAIKRRAAIASVNKTLDNAIE